MTSTQDQSRASAAGGSDDESPIAILRHLEDERGQMFTEAEYQQMRATVLEELAHGARLRPFTLLTFAIVGLGLLAMLVIGIVTAAGRTAGDYALAFASAAALAAAGYFFWSCLRGIKLDTLRSLDTRLAELEQLRSLNLVSRDEYERLHAHILIARQHGGQER
jgi:PHD/YefM family antitoxin component YafN of YafNO toxin-antitoxin module